MDVGPRSRTAWRTCPLCEAGCGLELTVTPAADGSGERVTHIRGDREDVFSGGFICPKGSTLAHLHEDPDRLRRPLVRRDGQLVEAGWDEAWAAVAAVLGAVTLAHGRGSLGIYLGNPNAHNVGAAIFLAPLVRSLGTRHVYSAATADQRPKEVSAGLMFGGALTIPVPDLDRTDFLLCLGRARPPGVDDDELAAAGVTERSSPRSSSSPATCPVAAPSSTRSSSNSVVTIAPSR